MSFDNLNPKKLGELFVEGMRDSLSEIFTNLLEDILATSYWIAIIGGLIGLILYIAGYKKGKNYPLISIAIYLIINIIGRAILNV